MSKYKIQSATSNESPSLPADSNFKSLHQDIDLYLDDIGSSLMHKETQKETHHNGITGDPSPPSLNNGKEAGRPTSISSLSPLASSDMSETQICTPSGNPGSHESRDAKQSPMEAQDTAFSEQNTDKREGQPTSSVQQYTGESHASATSSPRIKSSDGWNPQPFPSRFSSLRIQEKMGDAERTKSSIQNPALLSELAREFIAQMDSLCASRKLFCTDEYPKSFTGQEAVTILQELLPHVQQQSIPRKLARVFFRTDPPLIKPTAYAKKSLRKNTLYDSTTETYTLVQDTPESTSLTGVYTPLAACYSYSCRKGEEGCYSVSCPNKKMFSKSTEKSGRISVTSSSVAPSYDTMLSQSWQATIPREILQNIPMQEIKRQEAIHELIYTEEDYRRDLRLLDQLFASALRTAQCIELDRRDAFCDQVFHNYKEVLAIHNDLYTELHERQNACQANSPSGCVDQIGDIFIRHVYKFEAVYTSYGPHVALADYTSKREMSQNILYHNFIREKEKQAECRKLPFRHFLLLPVTRLQRYPLLLDAILKRTNDDHPDKDDISECVQVIKSASRKMDALMEDTKKTLRLMEINDNIQFKPDTMFNLNLLEPGRKLVHEGTLHRRVFGSDRAEIHVFLFDHLLVMAKTKPTDGHVEYFVYRRPIDLELLFVGDSNELVMDENQNKHASLGGTTPTMHYSSNPELLKVGHLGRTDSQVGLYADNEKICKEWKEKIAKAKADFEKAHPERRIFETRPLSGTTFPLTQSPAHHGTVTCSISFVGARGNQMIAIGTESGIWIGIEGDTSHLSVALKISNVTQMGVLEENHILLVLADKILYAYPLDTLDPTAVNPSKKSIYQQLASNVSFFNTGVCENRTLVVIMKRKRISSIFKAYEPVCGDLRDPRNAKHMAIKSSFLRHSPTWFKQYKEFYVGAAATSIQFLKARLAVVCERGFEIMDLNRLDKNHNLPELRDPAFAFIKEESIPLSMFRVQDKYLLCYNTFAFTVDMRGRLSEEYPKIEWEGTPLAVTFSHPYVIAFNARFIEIWHVETGKLAQVIAGENMRCLQYIQNAIASPVIHGCMMHPSQPQFQYVFHLVERA